MELNLNGESKQEQSKENTSKKEEGIKKEEGAGIRKGKAMDPDTSSSGSGFTAGMKKSGYLDEDQLDVNIIKMIKNGKLTHPDEMEMGWTDFRTSLEENPDFMKAFKAAGLDDDADKAQNWWEALELQLSDKNHMDAIANF